MTDSLWRWRLGLVAWMAMIFITSSSLFATTLSFDTTVTLFGTLNYVARKCAHMTEYAILALLWFRSIWTRRERFGTCLAWSVVLTVLYACTDEYHQSFIPERTGKASDVLFDGTGAALMALGLRQLMLKGRENRLGVLLGPLRNEES